MVEQNRNKKQYSLIAKTKKMEHLILIVFWIGVAIGIWAGKIAYKPIDEKNEK